MIDNVNKTEHRFDSIASVGKFGMKKVIPECFRSPPFRGREGQSQGVGAVMWMSLYILRVKSETMFLYHPCCSISHFHSSVLQFNMIPSRIHFQRNLQIRRNKIILF